MNVRLEELERAALRLSEALGSPPSMLQRDASIHRFEFTFELAWKAIQAALKRQRIEAVSPRDCVDQAWRQGWIDEEEHWLKMLGDRNLCSHIYKESVA